MSRKRRGKKRKKGSVASGGAHGHSLTSVGQEGKQVGGAGRGAGSVARGGSGGSSLTGVGRGAGR